MRRNGRLFILVGVVLAILAVGLIAVVLLSGGDDNSETSSNAEQQTEEPTDITVIVATQNVPAHTILTEDDLREETIKSDEITDGQPIQSAAAIVGFSYSVDLVEGQPLLESNRELPGLANRIDPGSRGVPLQVDPVNLIGGQLRDDDHVDVIFNVRSTLLRVNPTTPLELSDALTLDDVVDPETGDSAIRVPPAGSGDVGPTYPYPGEDGSRFWITDVAEGDAMGKIVLQNVKILRVVTPSTLDNASGNDEQSFVVLELTPGEAEVMDYLRSVGTYQLVLRAPDDDEIVQTPGVTMNMLVDDWGLVVPKTVRMPAAGAQ